MLSVIFPKTDINNTTTNNNNNIYICRAPYAKLQSRGLHGDDFHPPLRPAPATLPPYTPRPAKFAPVTAPSPWLQTPYPPRPATGLFCQRYCCQRLHSAVSIVTRPWACATATGLHHFACNCMGPICTVPTGVEAVAWSVDSSHLTEGGGRY